MTLSNLWRSFEVLYTVLLSVSQKYSINNVRSQLQRSDVICEQFYPVWPEGLLCDVERDRLAIAKFTLVRCCCMILMGLGAWIKWIDVWMKQDAAGGADVDRSSLTVVCEGAGYTQVPRDLPSTVVTVDLSDNAVQSLGPLSRLRHVVNLRLRGNHITRTRDNSSALPGYCLWSYTTCFRRLLW